MSVSLAGKGWVTGPACTGPHRLRPRRGGLLPCRWDDSCWSCGCGQGGDPLPAGDERVLPPPVAADPEGAAAGGTDEPARDMPQPGTQGIGLGVLQAVDIEQAEQPAPGLQVSGDVRGDGPAAVHPPGFRREVPQAGGFAGADAVLDDSMLAVQHVDELGV